MVKVISSQPYSLREGAERWDEIKQEVAANNLEELQCYAPNLTSDKILATEIRSPLDLERYNSHNWHGSCHGGDLVPLSSKPCDLFQATPSTACQFLVFIRL